MRAVFGLQLVADALELLNRLGAFDRVTLVEDKQRHAAYPVLAGQAQIGRDLVLADAGGHGLTQLATIKSHARALEQRNELTPRADIRALFEVATE